MSYRILDTQHWYDEDHEQRMLRKDVQLLLLEYCDTIIVNKRIRQLKFKHIGAGVYSVTKEPLPAECCGHCCGH